MRFTSVACLALLLGLVPAAAQAQITASPSTLSFTFPQGGTLPAHQTVNLTATPATVFNIAKATTSGGSWLDVTPLTGTTPGLLTVQLDPFSSGLLAGVYNGTITINQTLKIPVTLTVTTSLISSAASLSFTGQQATANPSAQTVNITCAASIPITATASSAGNWLSVTQSSPSTPATLTVSANLTGQVAGTYTGNVAVTSPSAPTINVSVTLTVTPPLAFSLAPASLTFQSTSALPQPPLQSVSVFSNIPSTLLSSSTTTSGGAWLIVSQSSSQTPSTFSISVNPSGLSPGTYSGQVAISATRSSTATSIPVTFTVAAPQPATLQLSPDTVTLASPQGGLPIQSGIAISNVGGGTLAYTAQITAQTGGTWLTLGTNSGSAVAGTPVTLPFTVSPGSLAPATYNATVTVTAGTQTARSLIVLTVNAQAPSLLLSQTGLAITDSTPPQAVSVVNTGSGALNWKVTTSTLSGGNNWLTASPSTGTTQPLPAVPPVVTITANPQSLAPGTYYGSVSVNSQIVSVQLTVPPPDQAVSPTLSSNGLVFTSVSGGTNPAPQSVSIVNPLAFTSTASTLDGANWLSATSSAAGVSVQASLAGLAPGIRTGTLRLGFADGSIQTVAVLFVVSPAGTASQFVSDLLFPNASGSCPSVLVPQITSLTASFSVTAAQSVPLSLNVVDDCGHALANSPSSSVIASFYDLSKPPGPSAKVQPDQRLTPQGNGLWSATWTPQSSVAQMEIIVVALGITGTTPIAGQTTLNGAVHAAGAGSPALSFGIFNAASYQPGNTVALGSFVSIFGAGLANAANTPTVQPLPVQVQGTQVLLGGVPLPLQYVGPSQINALIPATITVDSQQPLVIQRDATQAAPTSVTIADSQPGIYTANQQGTGQGAVLTSDYSLDAPTGSYPGAHPATRGDYIQVFCTGLGAVTNSPAAGAAAPNSPLSYTVGTVTATIGSVSAPVIFSGLAPGFIGLYQVNVTVPAAAPVGSAVPLTLSVGSATSNTTTIAIQ